MLDFVKPPEELQLNERTSKRQASASLETQRRCLSVFGMGYVGAVTSVCFADIGYQVVGVDLDANKVLGMNNGIPPITEEGLPERLSLVLNRGLFTATANGIDAILNSDVSLVSVCTPSTEDGGCDIRYLQAVCETIGQALKLKKTFHLVIFRSTVPPGTTENELIPRLERFSGKKCGLDFGVCFNPEFLRKSTAIEDFHMPPMTVIGASDERSLQCTKRLYENVGGEIISCSIKAAEYVKYIDNTWHALKVCFGNEVGRLCKATDVDSHEVMKIFCQDKKLNISEKYLMPGPAFGGSCLPKDVRGIQKLSDRHQLDLPLINSILHSNNAHINHAVDLIRHKEGLKVGFLGMTFKPGTDDMRGSPVVRIIEQLHAMGYDISVHDKHLSPETIVTGQGSAIRPDFAEMQMESAFALCEDVDIIVVAHDTKTYQELANIFAGKKEIIDLVGLVKLSSPGNRYEGICW